MLISSGTMVKTTTDIMTANSCRIDKGTSAMVLGVASCADPVVYLLETDDDQFEPEEFFCFADNIELLEKATV
jgi:hypothetical protein